MNIRPIAKILANRPKLVIILFIIFAAVIGTQITNIYMVSNFAEYLPEDDPTMKLLDQIDEEFQIGHTIIILVDQHDRIWDIRDPKVLIEMDEIYKYVYEKPLIEGKKTNIISIRSLAELIKNENAKPILEGGTGLREIPNDKAKIYEYMARITISSVKRVLYTDDFKVAVIIIQVSKDADFDEVLLRTEKALDNRGTNFANMTITGTVAMQKAVQQQSIRNFLIILPIAIIFISIVIFIFHRTLKGIIIAFLPPVISLVLTFGVLGAVQPELTMLSVAIVALLLGLGVDYSIHLMNRLVEENNTKDMVTRVEFILKSTGKAIVLSTATTMIGFSSLMISSMSPMATFGFGCAIGIFFCFISSIILTPCLVIVLKFDKKGKIQSWVKFANFIVKNRKRIILIATFFAVMSIVVTPYVKSDVNYMEMVPKGIPRVDAMYQYSRYFGGGSNFNAILIQTDPNGLLDPELINAICLVEEDMREVISSVFPDIDDKKIEKSVYSIADEIKEVTTIINRSVLAEKLANYVGVEKILFDMIAQEGIVDEEFSKTIILISIPIGSSLQEIEEVVKRINEIAENTVLPQNGKLSRMTGQDALTVSVNDILTDEQIRSMIVALILVLASLILIFNSTKFGFLTMIPVLFVLALEPGFLVLTSIPLSLVTISIASIMIGIGIDYGVHITHRFREELEKGKTREEAVRTSIEKTGLSLVEASLTTIAGMGSIYFINVASLQEFVTVIIFMTAASYIAAALILPSFYCSKFIIKEK
jgi:uncharacterized protein